MLFIAYDTRFWDYFIVYLYFTDLRNDFIVEVSYDNFIFSSAISSF